MTQLHGKVAFVTGASRGIGAGDAHHILETALRLVTEPSWR
jgi:NADP-dependent 3-hydroxy acid dehydrogenase YdfG